MCVCVCKPAYKCGRQCYVSPGESNSDHQAYIATFIFYYLQLSRVHRWVGRIGLLLERMAKSSVFNRKRNRAISHSLAGECLAKTCDSGR